MDRIYKYPRTPHLTGSRLQPGDEDLRVISTDHIKGRCLVVEEKLDGANSAISFSSDGQMLLQSRGHFLDGGARERHFALMKAWANSLRDSFGEIFGDRYIMYGEWLYAKHTIFYDLLPHYFFEFDIFDKVNAHFLSTPARKELLKGTRVFSVPVLFTGTIRDARQLNTLIKPSTFQSQDWRQKLTALCDLRGLDPERTLWRETDQSNLMEGLYLKVEEGGRVVERFKFVRDSFRQTVEDSGEHWQNRPIIPNQLREGAQIFAAEL